jgi:hypothetical protein
VVDHREQLESLLGLLERGLLPDELGHLRGDLARARHPDVVPVHVVGLEDLERPARLRERPAAGQHEQDELLERARLVELAHRSEFRLEHADEAHDRGFGDGHD